MKIVFRCCRLIFRKSRNGWFEKSGKTFRANHYLVARYYSTDQANHFWQEKPVLDYLNRVCKNSDDYLNQFSPGKRDLVRQLIMLRVDVSNCLGELEELNLSSKDDSAFKKNIDEEVSQYKTKLVELDQQLFESLIPEDESEDCNEAVVEVIPGVGGQEAMLFARDIFDMYVKYCEFKGWNMIVAEDDRGESGGLRKGSILIEGEESWSRLQFESGVHRVQRIPATEKSGRVHTSTVAVAVLPQPKEIDIQINERDIIIDTFRATGAGGQHVNTTDSAVRLTHVPSKVVIECQAERSQIKNREIALKRLKAKLFQTQYEAQVAQIKSLRKSQVGNRSRSEKVRTYNYNQDRITDHRISTNFHNVEGFLSGGKQFELALDQLIQANHEERVKLFLESIRVQK